MHAVIQQRNAALLAIQHGSNDMEVGEDTEARLTADEEVDDSMGINPQDDDMQVELDKLIDDQTEEMEETRRGDDPEPAAEQELGKCCL